MCQHCGWLQLYRSVWKNGSVAVLHSYHCNAASSAGTSTETDFTLGLIISIIIVLLATAIVVLILIVCIKELRFVYIVILYKCSHGCSGNAYCNNTDGGYWCEYWPGFQGDGYNCTGQLFDT